MDALSVENLCVKANEMHLLENITFSIKQGRVVAIIGPNGAGKTTLVKAILGLIPFQQGSVLLNGHPIGDSDISSKVGYVPQKLDFDRSFPLTVSELLHFTVPPAFSFPFLNRRLMRTLVSIRAPFRYAGAIRCLPISCD